MKIRNEMKMRNVMEMQRTVTLETLEGVLWNPHMCDMTHSHEGVPWNPLRQRTDFGDFSSWIQRCFFFYLKMFLFVTLEGALKQRTVTLEIFPPGFKDVSFLTCEFFLKKTTSSLAQRTRSGAVGWRPCWIYFGNYDLWYFVWCGVKVMFCLVCVTWHGYV